MHLQDSVLLSQMHIPLAVMVQRVISSMQSFADANLHVLVPSTHYKAYWHCCCCLLALKIKLPDIQIIISKLTTKRGNKFKM